MFSIIQIVCHVISLLLVGAPIVGLQILVGPILLPVLVCWMRCSLPAYVAQAKTDNSILWRIKYEFDRVTN